MEKFILALDQGTTSSRAMLFNRRGIPVAIAQKEFKQIYPQPGWVEHNPDEIWSSQLSVATEVLAKYGVKPSQIDSIGITNQRETTIVWDRRTGKPIYNAIVWQDRRTAPFCDQLRGQGKDAMIREKTGLLLDAYFSATKIWWILQNVPEARDCAAHLAFGTVDSWLLWKLTGGKVHATDPSNASRTMLYNIKTGTWDDALLRLFDVPSDMLPEVRPTSSEFGRTDAALFGFDIPVCGMAGDQQSALFGQLCVTPGMTKNTYGTGCFMMMNTGTDCKLSNNRMLTTVAWERNGERTYALEGSVFAGGAVIQWLRDGLGIIRNASETEALAKSVDSTGGLYLVPAFTGLGAPHWDSYARGAMIGITRGTSRAHIARAALESIAYQSAELLAAMRADSGRAVPELRVDGGASANNFLMQFQADVLGAKVVRPVNRETTATGAAYFAGLHTGFWKSTQELEDVWAQDAAFSPQTGEQERKTAMAGWLRAVERSKNWVEN
jgi:glycerol kinase